MVLVSNLQVFISNYVEYCLLNLNLLSTISAWIAFMVLSETGQTVRISKLCLNLSNGCWINHYWFKMVGMMPRSVYGSVFVFDFSLCTPYIRFLNYGIYLHGKIRYRIQQGSFDDFTIDNTTGLISIVRKLDYDKRENYRIEVVASDLGKIKYFNLI